MEGWVLDGDGLRDDQWARLEPFVPGGRAGTRGRPSDARRFFDAVLWLARTGARWRDLPADRFGPYDTIKRRYYRWIEAGVFQRIVDALSADPDVGPDVGPDLEWISIDATVIRAHPQAAGARRKRGERKPRLSADRGAASAQSCTP